MAVVGDSSTDQPGDVAGILFFHNSSDTPAAAVEMLLREFDTLGKGSIRDGVIAFGQQHNLDVKSALDGKQALPPRPYNGAHSHLLWKCAMVDTAVLLLASVPSSPM